MFDKQHLAMPTPVTPNRGNYGKHSKLAKWVYLLATALLIGMFHACGGGSGSGGEANPVVDTALAITKQPSEQTVSIGQTATFTVEATGATGYQWKKNDSNISGATSSSYTTPPTTLQDQGAIYTVTASNSVRSAYSSGAKLTVAPDPAISTQPRSQSVVAGQTATFTVTASGTAPFSYQWKKNGTDILGATSSSYTTPATSALDTNTLYAVTVSNSLGSTVASSDATLEVTLAPVAPTLGSQPASQTVTVGQTATFSVTPSGTAPFTYQWKKNGINISGATSSSYTTPVTSIADNGAVYTVAVGNSAGVITSSDATFTVQPAVTAPALTAQPSNQSVIAGQSATFSVAATGTAPLSYQWKKDGTHISGATSSSYTTPPISADTAALYTVTVSNSLGSVTSNSATVTLISKPTVTTHPSAQTAAEGQTASFSVTASGTAPLTYQWRKNGTHISGATASTYTTPVNSSADNGAVYSVVVSNSAGTATSNNATLTVYAAPSISIQPGSQTVNAGQTVSFGVVASGTGTLSYQWSKNGVNIDGATSSSYTSPATTIADNGAVYAVTISNAYGTVSSSNALLTVAPAAVAPTFSTQPASQSIPVGQTASFSVTVSGTVPLSYQWLKNGSNIVGATSSSYTTPAISDADNGAVYAVTVSNSAGAVTSSSATLTVLPALVAPTFSAQPTPQYVESGQSASFTATVTGTAPLSYQWKKNGSNIAGAISNSHTTPLASLADNGAVYTLTVSNSVGTVTSNDATLSVNAAPVIATQPASQSVAAGQTVSFGVVAFGSGTLSYQWSKNGVNISGATTKSYTTPATTSAYNGAVYTVTVSNAYGTVSSSNATLTVISGPTVTTHPSAQTAAEGQAASFSVTASGTAPLTYQWRKNGIHISGATASTYTTPVNSSADNGAVYSVVVANSAGTVTSNNATLTVYAAPSISIQPGSQTVNAGQTVSFGVVASGTGTLSYQWSKNGTDISGATSSIYTTPATTSADNGAVYAVTVSNAYGTVSSSNALLTVAPAAVAPTFSTQPASQSIPVGQTASFSVTVSGTVPLSYQWLKNGSNIVGATSSSYTTPAISDADNGALYAVAVSNSAGAVTSSSATLTVLPALVAPTFSAQPTPQYVEIGQSASFTATVTGTAPLSYQWKKNGSNIAGAISNSHTTPLASLADNGAVYTLTVSNSVGTVTSNDATLSVNAAPVIATQPASQSVAAGQTVSFGVVAFGSGTLSYQWSKNGTVISGATTKSYTTPATTSAYNGAVYTVTVSNAYGTVSSSNATLTVISGPTVTTHPTNQTVTEGEGQTASFSVVASGTAPITYQWRKNGINISGATSSMYTTPAASSADNGAVYSVVVSNSAGTATSNNATLTVYVAPSISIQPASQTVNAGQTVSFGVVASGTGALSYQWSKNGVNIDGATSSSYTSPATTSADNGAVYEAIVSNHYGWVYSSKAILRVITAPTVSTPPSSQTVTAGQTASFAVVASGTAPFTYQWRKNGSNIVGATSSSYTTPVTSLADNGAVYSVVVGNNAGTVTSSNATLTVAVVLITTQPASQTVNAGQTASFGVAASGTGTLSYQWTKNGTNISGATSSSYTTPATSSADHGAVYAVNISNAYGTVSSNNATLTVNYAPSISIQPGSQTVNAGQTASFGVAATGTATLAYQWTKGGSNISGATSSSYTTPATSSADNGVVYAVSISNAYGTVTSSNATLTVITAPTVSTQPNSQTVTAGQTASFAVTASGTAPFTYQWRKNGSNISGATSSSYTPVTSLADNGAVYSVVVGNNAGSVTSNNATLTVVAVLITTQPASQTVNAGQAASFGVAASGTGTLSYQWTKNGSNISGATSSTYTTPVTSSADHGAVYSVVVGNNAGTATSSNATLTVNFGPSISTQPGSQTVNAGHTVSFGVVATGTATLAYQWTKNGVNISGATASTYTTPATSSADNGAVYRVTVSNDHGTVTSSNATLTVITAPTVSTQPSSQTVTAGQTASFAVIASGTAPFTYQWRKNGSNISGATSSSYTPVTSLADNGAVYSVVVGNNAGSVTSNNATLTVVAVLITTQPASQTVNAGQAASFGVAASGTGTLSYQWTKNGSNISGATSSTYTTPVTSSADHGAVYSVVVGNNAGTATSSNATLTVITAPTVSTQPSSQTVTAGQTASFAVIASGTAPFTYQWRKNGINISGATTTSTYTTPVTVIEDNGAVFTVVVSNSAGTVTSSSATLTVNVPPAITVQPAAYTVTAGQTATFSVTATGSGTLSYQWKKNGTNITGGTGATSNTYTTPAMGYAGNGAVYSVVVSNNAGSVTSSTATLTVSKSTTTQSYGYVANASDGLYDKTECVQDYNTGLVWEGKTASPATSRLGTSYYTNYHSSYYGTQAQMDAASNTYGYVAAVNASGLCGYTDWRLPTKEELAGILASSGSPRIDTAWFPNTQAYAYWSSSPYVGNSDYAWYVDFGDGNVYYGGRYNYYGYAVRLVRASQ